MSWHPCCCTDCDVCNTSFDDITIDIGAALWSNGTCDYCDVPAGEYVLTLWEYGPGDCCWLYFDDDICNVSGNLVDFNITLCALPEAGDTGRWRWEAQIFIEHPAEVSSIVTYRTAYSSAASCWADAVAGKVTLTKVVGSETHGTLCTGSAAATVDIWQA